MSWFRRQAVVPAKAGMTRAAAGAALALTLGLGGCFTPLYSETAHPGLVQALREIEVAPIPERMGHFLADDLVTRLNGSGQTPKPKYRLTVRLNRTLTTPTIQSQIQTADSATVSATALYTLTRIDGETDKPVASGSATNSAVYDRTLQSYADLRAGRDAELRVAKALADEIELRVAGALSQAR